MSEQHERLLRRAYEAFNARDIQGALATMHPQVDWPNTMEGGRVHGHAGVREYWERQWGSFDSRVQPLRIEQNRDGGVVATVHQLVRDLAGNVVSDETVEHHYAITEGLIERMDVHDHWGDSQRRRGGHRVSARPVGHSGQPAKRQRLS